MKHTKGLCPYCDETPKPIMERHGFKLSFDEDRDIFVSLELGNCKRVAFQFLPQHK